MAEGDAPVSIPPEEVTVAIEGWNASDIESQEAFEGCLRSLRGQTYPIEGSRVLVLLDQEGQSGEADWILEAFPAVEIHRLQGATYYRTKNRCLELADSPYLVLADSDMVYQADWLERMLAAMSADVEMVVGDTRYQPGFLKHTLDLCDWVATRARSSFTDSFYANNLVLRRSLYSHIRFRDDMGSSGGGGSDVLRHQLTAEGVRPWYSAEARGVHDLPPFLYKRLRIGAFQIHYRREAPGTPLSWTARLGILSPFVVVGGTLVKAWGRAWRLRNTLPYSPWSLPLYIFSLTFVKALEWVGACLYVLARGWLDRRFGWFEVPAGAAAGGPDVEGQGEGSTAGGAERDLGP